MAITSFVFPYIMLVKIRFLSFFLKNYLFKFLPIFNIKKTKRIYYVIYLLKIETQFT